MQKKAAEADKAAKEEKIAAKKAAQKEKWAAIKAEKKEAREKEDELKRKRAERFGTGTTADTTADITAATGEESSESPNKKAKN